MTNILCFIYPTRRFGLRPFSQPLIKKLETNKNKIHKKKYLDLIKENQTVNIMNGFKSK